MIGFAKSIFLPIFLILTYTFTTVGLRFKSKYQSSIRRHVRLQIGAPEVKDVWTSQEFLFPSLGLINFFFVGCNNFATMADIAPTVFGCTSESDCTPNMKVESLGLPCLGFNCCESANFTSNHQVFAVAFRSINESKFYGATEPCKYAFLVITAMNPQQIQSNDGKKKRNPKR